MSENLSKIVWKSLKDINDLLPHKKDCHALASFPLQFLLISYWQNRSLGVLYITIGPDHVQ